MLLRKIFIFKLDDIKNGTISRIYMDRTCDYVEKYFFNTPLEDGSVENIFDFRFYIPNNSVMHEIPDDVMETKFSFLFRLMRNLYHHGRYNQGEHFHSQALEYMLHSSFPFAIEQLCIQFSDDGFIHRFWT
ncbi:hypothetical protein AQUCO_02500326v1 [Aquilegia coerulea]|uniref:Uncharacterized protein n=1 Tax=Aquilegia coerulea TaxID=218851 RepID=A0A2G5DAI4_AQUCA|nr:hypothetical protein AQUCO_02500326v1 [Aquilegia coerulea]